MSTTADAPQTVDGTVDDAQEPEQENTMELAVAAPARPGGLAVTPQVQAEELVERLAVIKTAMEQAMTPGVDYGVIPGTDKPSLFKPGSEKLGVLFQLDIQLDNEKIWGPGDHLTVVSHATAYHAPTGTRLGFGEGVCTTRERKYGKRRAELVCPNCGKSAVIKGKQEYGGGWLCWPKKDGCNSKWSDGAPEIEGQTRGDVENPDLPDMWNTVTKMAEKRARVDVVLAVTGASALFTQDMEDAATAESEAMNAPAAATNGSAPAPASAPRAERATAAPAQSTEKAATAKQRGLINARAGEKGLNSIQLANIVLEAAGQEARGFDDDPAAQRFVQRQLDRLPARLVDPILELIAAA